MKYPALLAALWSTPAMAYDVLLLETYIDTIDLQNYLLATGDFTSVDVFNTTTGTPTLTQLQAYDAVLVTANQAHADFNGLGQNLVDYANGGGIVVNALFTTYYEFLGVLTGPLNAALPLTGNLGNHTGMPDIVRDDPTHPIYDGVSTVFVSTYTNINATLRPGAELIGSHPLFGTPVIASWPMGAGTITSLEFHVAGVGQIGPAGIDYGNTDMEVLIGNALQYQAQREFTASTSGTCPGVVSFTASHGTPNGLMAVVSGTGLGSSLVPSGPCAGTDLGLRAPRLRATALMDATGTVTLSPTITASAVCGANIAMVDLTTCDVSLTTVP